MNKCLITGGTGFIGSHLVDYLLKDGVKPQNIRLLVRTGDKLCNLRKKGVKLIPGDITNKADVEKAVRGTDIVYHLAVKTGGDATPKSEIDKVNIDGTRNLAAAAVMYGVKKVIHFSSVAVYGSPGIVALRNVSEKHPKLPSDAYGRSKLEAEKVLVATLSKGSAKYIIIRPTHTYGSGSKGGLNQIIKAVKKGYFFFVGSGENKVDFIYVKDVVRLAREIEKSKITNEDFVVASGKPITLKNLVNTILELLDIKRPLLFLPKEPIILVGYIIKQFSRIIGKTPVITPEGVRTLGSDYYFNTAKLNGAGFYSNYAFKKGIAETIKYLNF